jgi:hypothetical protein
MKKLFSFFIMMLFFALAYTQAPLKMSYQAVIRDASGQLVPNSPVGVRFSIRQFSDTGTLKYQERHTVNTNENGLLTLVIGNGSVISGSLSSVDWKNGPYYLVTETDPNGGTSYSVTLSSQLMSVPFALYGADEDANPANEIQNLSYSNNNLSISGGNAVSLKREHTISLSGSVFQPTNDCAFYACWGNGGATITSSGSGALVAPLFLPDGAHLTGWTIYFRDESSNDFSVSLQREFLASGGFANVDSYETSGNQAIWKQQYRALNHDVDAEVSGYHIRVYCADWGTSGNKLIKGVKITYLY